MNSIAKLPLSEGARIILYADDILLYKPVNSTEDIGDLQCDVDKIFEWIRRQGLSPNYAKTHLLPVSRSRCKLPISLTLNGHPIPSCDTVKYLGVTLQVFLGLTTFNPLVRLLGGSWVWCIGPSTWLPLKSVTLSIAVLFFQNWTIVLPSGILIRSATKLNLRMYKSLLVESLQGNGSPLTQIY